MRIELHFLGNVGYKIGMGWGSVKVWWEIDYGSLQSVCYEIERRENLLVHKFNNL